MNKKEKNIVYELWKNQINEICYDKVWGLNYVSYI